MEQVFVSSVFVGLEEYRKSVCSAIDRLDGMKAVCMERFGSRHDPPLEVCLKKIREADYFIGIMGCNYGSSPSDDVRSYSEIEYDYAKSLEKPGLMFVAPENISMPAKTIETDVLRQRQNAFRTKIQAQHTTSSFATPADLGTDVIIGIHNLISEKRNQKITTLLEAVRYSALEYSASKNPPAIPMTTLMFPFITNQAGFDTGIAISNTSASPFGDPPRAGICTIHYYGGIIGGGLAPINQTSPVVHPGGQLVFLVSSGGGGIIATPGFQGYIVVECGFPNARGFAFVSDLGSQKVASGYLAEVIPNRTVAI